LLDPSYRSMVLVLNLSSAIDRHARDGVMSLRCLDLR
jgi:hypothetical protein